MNVYLIGGEFAGELVHAADNSHTVTVRRPCLGRATEEVYQIHPMYFDRQGTPPLYFGLRGGEALRAGVLRIFDSYSSQKRRR